jgi:hypothetical protein
MDRRFSTRLPAPPAVRSFYLDLYRRHSRLFAIEVATPYAYPRLDLALWDLLLSDLMPTRPVWGLAVDDMHLDTTDFRCGWLVLLPSAFSEPAARQALQSGAYYFSTTLGFAQPDPSLAPRIDEILHDPIAGRLRIRASIQGQPMPESAYQWLSAGTPVHVGSTLDYRQLQGVVPYVRAEISGSKGRTYTNPFGLQSQLAVVGLAPRDKTYDGTAFAQVDGTPALAGALPSHDVFLQGTPSFEFEDANAGENVPIATTGLALGGADAPKYFLAPPGLFASIRKADQTLAFDRPANRHVSEPVLLDAVASSDLPVDYAVEKGPARLNPDLQSLAIDGPGRITVAARQPGNQNWNPAPRMAHQFRAMATPAWLGSADWDARPDQRVFRATLEALPGYANAPFEVYGSTHYDPDLPGFHFEPLQEGLDFRMENNQIVVVPSPSHPIRYLKIVFRHGQHAPRFSPGVSP